MPLSLQYCHARSRIFSATEHATLRLTLTHNIYWGTATVRHDPITHQVSQEELKVELFVAELQRGAALRWCEVECSLKLVTPRTPPDQIQIQTRLHPDQPPSAQLKLIVLFGEIRREAELLANCELALAVLIVTYSK